MSLVWDALVTTVLTIYYVLRAIVLSVIPNRYRRKDVTGQIVLITGAGSGLGRLMSIQFARQGCHMVLWDINKEGNEETAKMLRKYGSKINTYVCDISKREEVYKAAAKVKQDVGDVDILINNAGIVTGKRFMECPDHMVQKTFEINSMAHFWTVKSFLPSMLERNHGHIVSVASSAGLFGVNGLADYCASKFAAVGFDESLKFELYMTGKTGIHTTVICPFFINTGMFDGVKTLYPWILPILEPDYAVTTIVDAILANQDIVCIPKILNFFLLLKSLLPVKAYQLMSRHYGVGNSMDDFRGRQQKIQ